MSVKSEELTSLNTTLSISFLDRMLGMVSYRFGGKKNSLTDFFCVCVCGKSHIKFTLITIC